MSTRAPHWRMPAFSITRRLAVCPTMVSATARRIPGAAREVRSEPAWLLGVHRLHDLKGESRGVTGGEVEPLRDAAIEQHPRHRTKYRRQHEPAGVDLVHHRSIAPASRRLSGALDNLITTTASERKHHMGIEDPGPDVAEEKRFLTDLDEDDDADHTQAPLEADPADFADQHRVIPLPDDDR